MAPRTIISRRRDLFAEGIDVPIRPLVDSQQVRVAYAEVLLVNDVDEAFF